MPLGKLKQVTDVGLFVSDVARSVAFYRDTLGLEVKRLDTGFAEFYLGNFVLAVWEADDLAGALRRPSFDRSGPHAMLAVRLDTPEELNALYEELVALGVPFAAAPADYPWNARGAYFTDPDDNLWELYCWLGAPRTL